MFASTLRSRLKRRGIVLVVVLGMLGLLALIGVTFATFANQAQISARGFAQSAQFPDASEVMDYALSQLIDDTANPASVIRGHSLKRDMYGSDAGNNGFLPTLVDGTPLTVRNATLVTSGKFTGMVALTTNIPSNNVPAGAYYYGYDFTRWVVRYPGGHDQSPSTTANPINYLSRTHEVLVDDANTDPNWRILYIPAPNASIGGALNKRPMSDPSVTGYRSQDLPTLSGTKVWSSTLTTLPALPGSGNPPTYLANFVLDGRYLRAFNGPGVSGMAALAVPGNTAATGLDNALVANDPSTTTVPPGHPLTEYANFRYNGNIFLNVVKANANPKRTDGNFAPAYGDPNDTTAIPAMDEDYDACDLENWFLAIQSADGSVVVPSFHRPGIISVNDWSRYYDPTTFSTLSADQKLLVTRAMSRMLRPRAIDGHSTISFPDRNLQPDASGKVPYDVDNDGDGSGDSVWLDLGYPPKRGTEGYLYKPLFSFMVIGLNGRLPLNTAGNLQRGTDHAEHLGNSPSEIDLKFALQNAWDPNFNPSTSTPPYTQTDNASIPVNLTQFRNILTGTRPYNPQVPTANGDANFVAVNNTAVYLPNNIADGGDTIINSGTQYYVDRSGVPPVSGRWGESDAVPLQLPATNATGTPPGPFNNIIRAGHSVVVSGNAYDARDDNFNTFDFNGETADVFDAAGLVNLPVERLRRFVTPIDLSGNGQVAQYAPTGPFRALGADAYGRVTFHNYFRPPGLPIQTGYYGADNVAGTIAVGPGPTYTGNVAHFADVSNNPYHGFVAATNPVPAGSALDRAGMPYNLDTNGNPLLDAMGNPTVKSGGVAPTPPTNPAHTYNYFVNSLFGSAGLNEADEMNLYQPTRLDAPFGPSDLEWLYRLQDVDGASLQSRLSQLAPISFLNPRDGSRRRRMFALDAWDTNNFVWANDNPMGGFPNNARFNGTASASFYNTNNTLIAPNPVNQFPNPDPASDFNILSNSGNRNIVPTPSLAHRDRKINLNFPLPVSNSPIEPIRQKWVRETYQLLKAILPPKAVDTPEELAQLSQFVVNVIDYRDPDATMTKFVNTDIIVHEPASAIAPTQATLQFSTANHPHVAYDPTYNPVTSPTPPNVIANPAIHYLVQYGMEYQPVAINEVLAFQHQWKKSHNTTKTAGLPANDNVQVFVEVVNTLTQDALTTIPDTSDLDLANWDFVVLPDDAQGRPDPFTGQIPLVQTGVLFNPQVATPPTGSPAAAAGVPLAGGQAGATTNAAAGVGAFPIPSALTTAVKGDVPTAGRAYYYVFGTQYAAQSPRIALPLASPDDTKTPTYSPTAPLPTGTGVNLVDLTGMLYQRQATAPTGPVPVANLNPGYYYWLYLRRPANPFDPTSDKIVVDSFRFLFQKSKGQGYSDDSAKLDGFVTGATPAGEYIFSLQRPQPFRGGHAVPPITTTASSPPTLVTPYLDLTGASTPTAHVMPAYGYSEQTFPGPVGTAAYMYYGDSKDYTKGGSPLQITGEIRHTIGSFNKATVGATAPPEARDYFPFNDRDFTSVVELTMVPSCAPGLFTKQFAELPPPIQAYMGTTPQELYLESYPVSTTTATPGAAGPLDTTLTTYTGSAYDSTNVPVLFASNGFPHTFPYLNDEFFYTAVSEPIDNTKVTPAIPGNWVATEPTPPYGPTNPMPYYRSATTDANGINHYIGGPGGSGWFKMLDFFEVPSPMFGAIGPVPDGMNYDWARQDLKPGLLNLNLIIDEEVFLGLMGESVFRKMNQGQIGMPGSPTFQNTTTPIVVTQVNDTGAPTGKLPMLNTGFFDLNGYRDPKDNNFYSFPTNTNNTYNALMKACFADFLSLRHGGTGYLFAYGTGSSGSVAPVAAERPFHSLSYPDIDYTVFRPATLPPSANTVPTPNPTPGLGVLASYPLAALTGTYAGDPGLKNPYLFATTNTTGTSAPIQPAPIPTRRLFQISDAWGGPDGKTFPGTITFGTAPGFPSNASTAGDPNVNQQVAQKLGLTMGGVAMGTQAPTTNGLYYPDLTDIANLDTSATPAAFDAISITGNLAATPPGTVPPSQYLGAINYGGATGVIDQRDHPYFRSEWLQKVTSLTTVRTHQYAVWITVGFFEVTRQGDPLLATTDPISAYDTLGLELGVLDGKNVRYRGFFLVDRTRAAGFNPALPGDFRSCVVYRQLIE